jgi:hypothetical protein
MSEVHEAEKIVAALLEQQAVLLARSRLPPSEQHLAAVAKELEAAQAQLDLAKTKKIERDLFIEKQKGPKSRGGNYVPLPPTAEETARLETQWQRQERLKQPPQLRVGDQPPPTIEERKQQFEREAFIERMKGPV